LYGRVTDCPAENRASKLANVHSRVSVGVGRETTCDAEESVLRRTIGLRDVPTRGASLTGVSRVNEHNRHTGQRRLVMNELPQLV
jgi:hypothetical protein